MISSVPATAARLVAAAGRLFWGPSLRRRRQPQHADGAVAVGRDQVPAVAAQRQAVDRKRQLPFLLVQAGLRALLALLSDQGGEDGHRLSQSLTLFLGTPVFNQKIRNALEVLQVARDQDTLIFQSDSGNTQVLLAHVQFHGLELVVAGHGRF